jgi:hypothetical protein
MKALTLLLTLQSADIVLPTTYGSNLVNSSRVAVLPGGRFRNAAQSNLAAARWGVQCKVFHKRQVHSQTKFTVLLGSGPQSPFRWLLDCGAPGAAQSRAMAASAK